MKLIQYLKANIGFVITLIVIAVIAFSPEVKGVVLSGIMKTGLFQPDVQRSEPAAAVGVESGSAVGSVKFTGAGGKTVDLADLKGKVVFLNFWATWCPPCIAEMPSVNGLYSKFKDDNSVVFILADADGDLAKSASFMKKHKYDLPVYVPAGSVPSNLFRGSLPTTIILNKKGEIVFAHEGMADYNSPKVVTFLKDLLK